MRQRPSEFLAITLLVCAGVIAGKADDVVKIRQWIGDLDSDQFRIRETASKHLQKAGAPALGPLADAANGSSPEVTNRAMAILHHAALADDPALAAAARKSVRILLRARNEAVANRAKAILAQPLEQIVIVLEYGGVKILRTGNIISGIKLSDGTEVAIDLERLPDAKTLTLNDPLFGDAQPRLLQQLANVTELNLFMSSFRDDGLPLFQHFPNLKRVPMGLTNITDAGLVHLKNFKNLQYVGLRGNQITDMGLAQLQGMTNLTGLNLAETKVTDAGLAHLKGLTEMESLYLYQTAITDQGLEHLHAMSRLSLLDVTGTQVTAAGLARLREKCKALRVEGKQ